MTHDLKQLRADAERVQEMQAITGNDWGVEIELIAERLAAFVRNLTDETPLTVERLIELGGERVGDDGIRLGDLYFSICEVEGTVGVLVGKVHLPRKLWPRTVGELNQLLMRLEGP